MTGWRPIVGFVVVLVPLASTAFGQNVRVPRTADGRPDLQGTWDNTTATQLQRPAEFADKTHFTEDEARAYEKTWLERLLKVIPEDDRTGADLNEIYLDDKKVGANRRTSLIVDPPNGKIPALVKAAQDRNAARPRPTRDDPEARPLGERCLLANDGGGLNVGAPINPNPFGLNYYRIVQTQSHVIIFGENMHESRIIRIGGRHLPDHMQTWLGDSVGRWEGDTLVVDTTNFSEKVHWRGSTPRLHVTERFTRTGPSTLTYRATIEDPDTWEVPWTIEVPFVATTRRLFEYACHEGNWAIEGVLRGARAEERRKSSEERR
jgi:hypothetical protein